MATGKKNKSVIAHGGLKLESEFLDGAALMDRLAELLIEELTPVFNAMEEDAKRRVPVSGQRESFGWNPNKSGGSFFGFKEKATRTRMSLRSWKKVPVKLTLLKSKWRSRSSGRLKSTISSSVVQRLDKTAVLGFLEAGSAEAFYARWVEFGTIKMAPRPFLRPAFYAHYSRAVTACNTAVERWSNEND